MLLVWSWPPPFFAPKGVDRPWILAFTTSALRGRLAVGTYSNLSAPPGIRLHSKQERWLGCVYWCDLSKPDLVSPCGPDAGFDLLTTKLEGTDGQKTRDRGESYQYHKERSQGRTR